MSKLDEILKTLIIGKQVQGSIGDFCMVCGGYLPQHPKHKSKQEKCPLCYERGRGVTIPCPKHGGTGTMGKE